MKNENAYHVMAKNFGRAFTIKTRCEVDATYCPNTGTIKFTTLASDSTFCDAVDYVLSVEFRSIPEDCFRFEPETILRSGEDGQIATHVYRVR